MSEKVSWKNIKSHNEKPENNNNNNKKIKMSSVVISGKWSLTFFFINLYFLTLYSEYLFNNKLPILKSFAFLKSGQSWEHWEEFGSQVGGRLERMETEL